MDKDIGKAAGKIWEFLKKQSEPVSLSTITKNVELPSTIMMMGLGWLAREGNLEIEMSGNSYSICLKS